MRGIEDPETKLPELKNDGRMHVSLFGNYFEQNKVIIPNNNNVINNLLRLRIATSKHSIKY